MKYFLKLIVLLFILHTTIYAQYQDAKIYWVGHSLISGSDPYVPWSQNLMYLMDSVTTSQGHTYDFYEHITPGAPVGYNWGATQAIWDAGIGNVIQPLLNTEHADYGTYNTMVVTEGITIQGSYTWWATSFFVRQFFAAARAANPNCRLFFYESWHHLQATDDDGRNYYGPISQYDFIEFMDTTTYIWDTILDRSKDPTLTQLPIPEYEYQGPGQDPGVGFTDTLHDAYLIPTGPILVKVLKRLEQNLPTDDWSFGTDSLTSLDFFVNPLANFPTDTVTPIHPNDPVDDIHPSHVLVYLNTLVHYSVIYQQNPINVPALNGVPENIAAIFREIVWDHVINDPRTGVSSPNPVQFIQHRIIEQHEDQFVEWETAVEYNVSHFNIEGSSDGKTFHQLASVQANGSEAEQYAYRITQFVDQYKYYRIKSIDFDQSHQYSPILTYNKPIVFKLFPNPVSSNGILHIATTIDEPMVFIHDILHQNVRSFQATGHALSIESLGLKPGLYSVRIGNSTQKLHVY